MLPSWHRILCSCLLPHDATGRGMTGCAGYSLIMTPDTVSSSAAMRVDVTTDKNTGRWGAGSGGSTVTSARQGMGGGVVRTTAVHTGWPPQRSINIHSASLIPDLINDVKAMTQQSLAQQRRPPHVNWLEGRTPSPPV